MKKLLFVSHAMELGGAERALLGLLHTLDKEQYQIDLFLLRHTGPLLSQIPDGVRLLPEKPEYAALLMPLREALRRRQLRVVWGRLKGKLAARRYCRRNRLPAENSVGLLYSHKYTAPYLPELSPEAYDLAVSFLTPHYIAAEKVHARRKLAWIHTDYSRLTVDPASELEMWSRYDRIVSISESVSAAFCARFPGLAERLMLIENIAVPEWIRRDAGAFTVEEEMPADGSIRILSIGRFCTAKNFDSVPEICSRLRARGLHVKWYLIGFGGDEALIRRRIAEAGMEDAVLILGRKENPYPYLRACDLYVQPSRYEGNAVTVHEAQLLGKPVVITSYPTAGSQLHDGVDGVVVPTDNRGCADGIAQLLNDPARMAALAAAAARSRPRAEAQLEQLCRLTEA